MSGIREVETALYTLSTSTGGIPIVDAYRQFSNLEQGITDKVENRWAVFSPAKGQTDLTVVVSNREGLLSDDVLAVGFLGIPIDRLGEKDIDPDGTMLAEVECGYVRTNERGGIAFGVEARLPETFDPSSEQMRWVLKKVMEIGKRVDDYFREDNTPKPLNLPPERARAILDRMIGKMSRNNEDLERRLRQQGIHIKTNVDIRYPQKPQEDN